MLSPPVTTISPPVTTISPRLQVFYLTDVGLTSLDPRVSPPPLPEPVIIGMSALLEEEGEEGGGDGSGGSSSSSSSSSSVGDGEVTVAGGAETPEGEGIFPATDGWAASPGKWLAWDWVKVPPAAYRPLMNTKMTQVGTGAPPVYRLSIYLCSIERFRCSGTRRRDI
eukprot:3043711-Pyramimonas_sp.AAC.2